MKPSELKSRIEALSPGTVVEVKDLTGTEDHYHAVVVSAAFNGKPMIQQHRMVFDLLAPELKSGEVHALTLKTSVPK